MFYNILLELVIQFYVFTSIQSLIFTYFVYDKSVENQK